MRITENQKQIIKAIGSGILLLGALVAPGILRVYKRKNYKQKYRLKSLIRKLEKDDVIYLFGDKVKLTEKGKNLLKTIEIEDIFIKNSGKWNGIWHLVCYDIPEYKKTKRDYFRKKLQDFGFYVIQDSLWVYPYECKEEIAVIAQSLGISPNVAYLNTDYLPQQYKLIKFFKLIKTTE